MLTVPLCVLPSALPARFKEELRNQEIAEGDTATLRCKLTKVAPVDWRKGQQILKQCEKYTMKQEGTVLELVINNPDEKDAGEYSCVCGDQQTTATLRVNGKQCHRLLSQSFRRGFLCVRCPVTLSTSLSSAVPSCEYNEFVTTSVQEVCLRIFLVS